MARTIVLGAGVMGLAAEYPAADLGHQVTLIDAAPDVGGMACHFGAWRRPHQAFVDEAMACLVMLNPAIRRDDLVASHVGRLKNAQPICPPNFLKMIPPVQTPVAGLQIADTCFYYPEDREITESVRLGQKMARAAIPAPSHRV